MSENSWYFVLAQAEIQKCQFFWCLAGSSVVQTAFSPLKGASGGGDREVMPSSVQFPAQPSYSAAMPGATTTTAAKVEPFHYKKMLLLGEVGVCTESGKIQVTSVTVSLL
jgi:hypothetical protein